MGIGRFRGRETIAELLAPAKSYVIRFSESLAHPDGLEEECLRLGFDVIVAQRECEVRDNCKGFGTPAAPPALNWGNH